MTAKLALVAFLQLLSVDHSVFQPCVGVVGSSLFSLPAESEASRGFFQQAAITYACLPYMLWLLHLMTVLNGVTLPVQGDGV